MSIVEAAVIAGAVAAILLLTLLGHIRIKRQLAMIRATRREVETLMSVLDERAETLQARCNCGFLHNVRGARRRLADTRTALEREEGAWV